MDINHPEGKVSENTVDGAAPGQPQVESGGQEKVLLRPLPAPLFSGKGQSRVNPRLIYKWLSLGSLSAAVLFWGLFVQVPTRLEGRGTLIRPQEAVALQSRVAGQVLKVKIKVGDWVRKGQVLAEIDQPVLRQQLQQLQSHLLELQQQNVVVSGLQNQRTRQNLLSIERQIQSLHQQLGNLEIFTPVLRTKLESLNHLAEEGAIAIFNIERDRVEAAYLQNLNQIAQIKPQLDQLQTQAREIRLQDTQETLVRKNQIDNLKRQIQVQKSQLSEETQVVSDSNGRILDLSIVPGQFVAAGTRLTTLEQKQPTRSLVAINYFTVGDAKRILPGMAVEITPDLFQRDRFGGIVGQVRSVSRLPATAQDISRIVGNEEIAKELTSKGAVVQVVATLQPDSSTFSRYRWTFDRGPQLQISEGTTATVRVIVEQRTPVSYLVQGIRWLTGIYR